MALVLAKQASKAALSDPYIQQLAYELGASAIHSLTTKSKNKRSKKKNKNQ